MPLDPSNIPEEILDAAITLNNYFRQQGIEDWVLRGVCSRSMYERCKAKHDLLVARVAYSDGWNFSPSS